MVLIYVNSEHEIDSGMIVKSVRKKFAYDKKYKPVKIVRGK